METSGSNEFWRRLLRQWPDADIYAVGQQPQQQGLKK